MPKVGYIYRPRRFSGTTLQKTGFRMAYASKMERREVLPGYPILTPFASREELDDYFANDELICLHCGKPYQRLNVHLTVHGTNVDAYKRQYNIPITTPLMGKSLREHYVEIGYKLFNSETGKGLLRYRASGKRSRYGPKTSTITQQEDKKRFRKYPPELIQQIRKLHTQGMTQYKIGKLFNLSTSHINYIVRYKGWKDI